MVKLDSISSFFLIFIFFIYFLLISLTLFTPFCDFFNQILMSISLALVSQCTDLCRKEKKKVKVPSSIIITYNLILQTYVQVDRMLSPKEKLRHLHKRQEEEEKEK